MARDRRGRPPVPEAQRKRTITVYLAARVVRQIELAAEGAGVSRNQLIARVLAAQFGIADGQEGRA